jgi:ligand-binding sensor domain-containing protein
VFIVNAFLCCKREGKSETKQAQANIVETGTSVDKIDDQIWAVFQDSKESFWFGSNGRGVYRFDGITLQQYTTEDGLVDNQVRGIQEDKNGNIYIETPKGVSKFDGATFSTLKVINPSNSEWKKEPTDLWFHCNGSTLYRYDGKWLHELYLPPRDITALFDDADLPFSERSYSPYSVFGIDKDKDGNIWFGTVKAGAFRFDGTSFLWFGEKELSTLPDGRVPGVRSMIQDNNGYFWLSNFYSKYKINPSLPKGYEKVKAVDLPKDIVKDKVLYFNSGISDKEGNLWMTTYRGGVWKYDGKTLSNQEIQNGEETVLLLSIYEDRNGTIWLGTKNDGVYKQNGNIFEKFEPNR